MTTPLGGPGYGFGWYPGPSAISTTGALTTGSTAVSALATAVTLKQGQQVLGTGITTPSFVAASVSGATNFTLDKVATATGTEALTFQPWPTLIGGEFTGALAAGDTLISSYWNGTGIFQPADFNAQGLADLVFTFGAGGATFGNGAVLSVYYLRSYDRGVTFEPIVVTSSTTVPPLSRGPDATISLSAGTYAAGDFVTAPMRLTCDKPFMVALYNASGVSVPAGSGLVMAQGGPNY